jgi:hypothetical protein
MFVPLRRQSYRVYREPCSLQGSLYTLYDCLLRGTNMLLSLVSRMLQSRVFQECDITGGDNKEVSQYEALEMD